LPESILSNNNCTDLKRINLPLSVFLLIFLLLSLVQIMGENPMILAERFAEGAGWIGIDINI